MSLLLDILRALFGHKGKPAPPPPDDCPSVMQYITVWLPDGGGATTAGTARLRLDQFGEDIFVATVLLSAPRLQFTLPSNTNLLNGGDLWIDGVPGCAPYHSRVLTTKDGLDNEVDPPGNISLTTDRPWEPCPRTYSGNMCGVYVPGLPPVAGGAKNPALVLSWFLDRYSAEDQARIKQAWKDRGLRDVLVSWPDSRAAGASPESFAAFCVGLYKEGFEPAVMLCSKVYDPPNVDAITANVAPVLSLLRQQVGRFCVGWELSLWLSPTQVQQLIDWMAPQVTPWGGRLYVHFQIEYASFQQPDHTFADFWNANVGKLTGLFYQGDCAWTPEFLQAKMRDCLDRFAGGFYCSPDSGFGHPFDDIGLELQAEAAFNSNVSEATQNAYAHAAVTTPPATGPFGPVRVMGSGNGCA